MDRALATTNGGGIFGALLDLQNKSELVREQLPLCDDETLKALFAGLEGATTIAWQLQADIIAELQGRARYGSNAMGGIAKFLEINERRVFELAQIRNEILLEAPELRDANLDKSHFLAALRAKRHGKNPVDSLNYALDHSLTVREFRRYIDDNKDAAVYKTSFYTLKAVDDVPVKMLDEAIQRRYLSPTARIVQYGNDEYLELREQETMNE